MLQNANCFLQIHIQHFRKTSNFISATFVNQILKEWGNFGLTVDLHLKSVHQNPHLSTEPQLEQFISAFFSTTGKLTGQQRKQSSNDSLLSCEAQSTQVSKATAAFPSTLQGEKQNTRQKFPSVQGTRSREFGSPKK